MSDIPQGHRRCPFCAEIIRVEARLCRHCGSVLVRDLEAPPRVGAAMELAQPHGIAAGQASRAIPSLTLGDRRVATVFFFDIQGYTRMVQALGPEELQTHLSEFFSGAISIIERHSGTIDNIVGDQIMSVFGVPVAGECDPEQALRAACEVLDHLREFNATHPHEFHIHGGINSGLVVTGEIGGLRHSKFSLVGTTVNLASRMTSAAGTDEIYVSWETYEQTGGQFVFEPVGPLRLRDFDEPQRVFRLVGLNPEFRGVAPPPRAIRAPFIGRGPEIHAMREELGQETEGGRPPALFVSGEVGIGKTRLVLETVSRHFPDATFARGAGTAWSQDVTLFAVVDLLRNLLGISPLESSAGTRARIQHALEELGRRDWTEAVCLLHLLGDPEAADLMRGEEAERRMQRIFDALIELFRLLSRRRPLILFFDDAHWFDPTTALFLRQLFAAEGHGRGGIVLAGRSDPHRWDFGGLTTITLSPFTEEESRLLLENVLQQIGVGERLQQIILNRGEGIPLFLEELARLVREEIMTQPPERAEELEAKLETEIPRSIHNLIQARLDRLEIKTRLVLQCGAVLGREFLFDVMALIELIREGLMDRLFTLESLQIILRGLDEKFLKYYFKNSLTQEVVYQSMLRRQRQELHHMVASALERLHRGRLREFAAQIAFHWDLAGDRSRAAALLVEAARRASDLGDTHLAELQAESAIDFLTDLDATDEHQRLMVEALLLRAQCHRITGRPIEAQRTLHAALSTARSLGEASLVVRALADLGLAFQLRGRYGWAIRLLRGALERSEPLGDRRQVAVCHQRLGIIAWQQGRLSDARGHVERITELVPDDVDPVMASDSHNNLGLICWSEGDLHSAHRELQRAAELRRQAHLVFGEVATACNLGIVCEQLGRFREAGRHYHWAAERANALRYRRVETALHANMANLLLLRRQWRQALESSVMAEGVASEIDDRRSVSIALENRALSEIGLGLLGDAAGTLRRAQAIATELDDFERQASLGIVWASLEIRRSDLKSAGARLGESRAAIEEQGLGHMRTPLLRAEGELALARGEAAPARSRWDEALAFSRETNQRAEEVLVLRSLVEQADRLDLTAEEREDHRAALGDIERELQTV